MNLKDLKVNQKCKIKKINATGVHCRKLFEMGFLPGTIMEFKYQAPLGFPKVFKLRGYEIILSKKDVSAFEVDIYEK
jgi:Fe2+ transport system protein FeoA